MMWTPNTVATGHRGFQYSLGWMVSNNDTRNGDHPLLVYHAGGAIGASSILVIIPGPVSENGNIVC